MVPNGLFPLITNAGIFLLSPLPPIDTPGATVGRRERKSEIREEKRFGGCGGANGFPQKMGALTGF